MPGPPKKPSKLAAAQGNPGKRPLNLLEPQPAPTTANPPEDLTGDARALWMRLAPEFVRMGTMTAIDRDELAFGCRLRAAGLEALTECEHQHKTPSLALLSTLRDSSRILARFGVGASDRTKIHVQPPVAPSKWRVA